jgi:hypothetical protein
MIVYVSYPYAYDNLESRNKAIESLNKLFAKLYKTNTTWCFVNSIFSTYNNPDLNTTDMRKATFFSSKTLLDSCSHVIIVRKPGWDYSEIVTEEGRYAYVKNLPISYIDFDE